MSKTFRELRWCAGEIHKSDGYKNHDREIILTHKQAKWLLKKLRELEVLKLEMEYSEL